MDYNIDFPDSLVTERKVILEMEKNSKTPLRKCTKHLVLKRRPVPAIMAMVGLNLCEELASESVILASIRVILAFILK